jgi:hypothetical protein
VAIYTYTHYMFLWRCLDIGTTLIFHSSKVSHVFYVIYYLKVETNVFRRATNDQVRNVQCKKSRDSSVGIALGYGLNDRGSRVRFPAGAGNFSLHHCIQNGFGGHAISYPVGTRGCFLWDKAAGA